MLQIFAVMLARGENWNDAHDLEQQELWQEHRDFMNALEAEGFVVLGGPLKNTRDVLLIFRARSEGEIKTRLAKDPWHISGLLRIVRINPWDLRIGAI